MNISNALLNHRDSVNFRMDRARSEGEVNLCVISITMDRQEVLRNNVEEVGDVESAIYNKLIIFFLKTPDGRQQNSRVSSLSSSQSSRLSSGNTLIPLSDHGDFNSVAQQTSTPPSTYRILVWNCNFPEAFFLRHLRIGRESFDNLQPQHSITK